LDCRLSHEEILAAARKAGEDGHECSSVLAMLAEQAARCRRLASATLDRDAAGILAAMAADYERTAETLNR
jgi:hypothetical protein